MIPHLEHLPYVGFKPTVPVKAAGCLIDPPVSVPNEPTPTPAATDASEPPEDPPCTRLSVLSFFFHLLMTLPQKLFSFY